MIEELRVQEKKLKTQASDVMIGTYNGEEDIRLEQVNCLFRVRKMIENSWSEEQRNAIVDAIEHEGSQMESAKRLNTTQPTIARRLASGKYSTYLNVEDVLNKSIVELTK